MPCMSTQSINDDAFLECLGFLAATIEELDCTCITIIGDWNADVSNDKHQFGNYFNQFCSDIGLIISSELKLPEDSFTYKSYSWHTTSWIDHCVSSKDGHDIIHDMDILYPESTGDHVHLRVGVSIERIPTLDESSSNSINRLDWSRLSKSDIDSYTLLTDAILGKVHTPVVALNCRNVDCTDPSHVAEVNLFYENLISSITSADTEAFANGRNGRRDKAYNRPGWSDYVDELHQSARECFLLWRDTGTPRQGKIFDLMQQSRARFKYAIRAIKHRENALRRESLAKKMTSN